MKSPIKDYTKTESEKRWRSIRELAGIFVPFLLILALRLFFT